MTKTYFDELTFWGVNFKPQELFVPIQAVKPEERFRHLDCLHGLEEDTDFSTKTVLTDGEQPSIMSNCIRNHAQSFRGPDASKALRTAELLFIAQYLKRLRFLTELKMVRAFGEDEFKPEPAAYYLYHLTEAITATTDTLFESFGINTSDKIAEIIGSIQPCLKEKFHRGNGLPGPKENEPLAYFEFNEVESDLLLVMKHIYTCFEALSDKGKDVVIMELPVSFLNAPKARKYIQTKGAKTLKVKQDLWEKYQIWSRHAFEPPLVTKVHPHGSSTPERTETLKVLAKEMPFREALKSATALSESS